MELSLNLVAESCALRLFIIGWRIHYFDHRAIKVALKPNRIVLLKRAASWIYAFYCLRGSVFFLGFWFFPPELQNLSAGTSESFF